MANEFVFPNGFIISGSSPVDKTAMYISGAISASMPANTIAFVGTASNAISTSYTVTYTNITNASTTATVFNTSSTAYVPFIYVDTTDTTYLGSVASNTYRNPLGFTYLPISGSIRVRPTGSSAIATLEVSASSFAPAIIVSSSTNVPGIVVTGSVNATSFTGSLFGTASYVTGSIHTGTNPALSASYAVTAAYALTGGTGGGGGTTFVGSTNVDNRIITATGNTPNELNGESNLTFDGSVLKVTGSVILSSSLQTVAPLVVSGSLFVSGSVVALRPSYSWQEFSTPLATDYSAAVGGSVLVTLGTVTANSPTIVNARVWTHLKGGANYDITMSLGTYTKGYQVRLVTTSGHTSTFELITIISSDASLTIRTGGGSTVQTLTNISASVIKTHL